MYNAPSKVTANWFPKKMTIVATMVGTTSNLLGNLLGFFLPRIFIKPKFDKKSVVTES